MEDILVERYFDEPIDFDSFEGLKQKAPWCVEQNQLSHLGTFIDPNNKDMYCHYRAPDADSFRVPSREHDVHFTRAWTAHVAPGADADGDPTPAGLVRQLCPEAYAAPSDEPPEPMPRVAIAYGDGAEAAAAADELARTAPARHLVTYRSTAESRVLLLFADGELATLQHALPAFRVHETIIRLRHLRH